jgi:hypothetical protein
VRRDQVKSPVAPASAIRANINAERPRYSTDCALGKVVSPRRRMCIKPRRRGDSVDFARVNREALAVLPAVLRRLLPHGKSVGREFVALNPRRSDRHRGSFKVNVNSGRWSDFATGDNGGDPISLLAYLANVSQYNAARLLAQMLGIQIGHPR